MNTTKTIRFQTDFKTYLLVDDGEMLYSKHITAEDEPWELFIEIASMLDKKLQELDNPSPIPEGEETGTTEAMFFENGMVAVQAKFDIETTVNKYAIKGGDVIE